MQNSQTNQTKLIIQLIFVPILVILGFYIFNLFIFGRSVGGESEKIVHFVIYVAVFFFLSSFILKRARNLNNKIFGAFYLPLILIAWTWIFVLELRLYNLRDKPLYLILFFVVICTIFYFETQLFQKQSSPLPKENKSEENLPSDANSARDVNETKPIVAFVVIVALLSLGGMLGMIIFNNLR